MRANNIMPAFRQNKITISAITSVLPEKFFDAMPKPVTTKKPAIDPIGNVGQMRLRLAGVGPPIAKVPAQLIKIAQTGKCQGNCTIKTVVTASSDATTSCGGFFMFVS